MALRGYCGTHGRYALVTAWAGRPRHVGGYNRQAFEERWRAKARS
jgi:hypothetical protein